MKRLFAILICIAAVSAMVSGCGKAEPAAQVQVDEQLKIALISMGQADPSLMTGARKASGETDAELIDMAAENVDVSQQIHTAVSSGCQVMVVAAEDMNGVSAVLEEAKAAGMKIVFVNAPAGNGSETVFATDNGAAGRAIGERMIETLKSRGITSGVIGVIGDDSQMTLLRENGFRTAFEAEAYTLVNSLTDEADPEKYAFIAGNYISNGAKALFCCGEDMLVGAGQALKDAQGNAVVMGFGQSDAVKTLVEKGYVHAAVIQNFDAMGYEAVKAAAAMLESEAHDGGFTDTGMTILETEAPDLEMLLTGDFQEYKIAMITMDRVSQSWKWLEEGVMKAAEELGCEVVNMSPVFQNTEEQIMQIFNAVNEECDAIIIASGDSEAVNAALHEAIETGVGVICVDEPAAVEAEAVYITDNKAAGKAAGMYMISELEKREIKDGPIGIIGINAQDEAGIQREAGFREAFEGTTYTLLETQYGEGDAALSHLMAIDDISREVVGIFCCSEGAVNGAGNAVIDSRANVVLVGFGASERIQDMIEADVVQATVMKDFSSMGYEAVRGACAALKGGNLDKIIDVGSYMIKK